MKHLHLIPLSELLDDLQEAVADRTYCLVYAGLGYDTGWAGKRAEDNHKQIAVIRAEIEKRFEELRPKWLGIPE